MTVSPPAIEGQGQSYVLRTDLAGPGVPPYWDEIGQRTFPGRWYPTLTTLANGDVLQVGDTVPCHAGGSECVHTGCGDDFRQRFTLEAPTPAWGPLLTNRLRDAGLQDCTQAAVLSIPHYPRLHLLRTREIMWVDGEQSSGGSHVAYFLNADDNLPPDCPADPSLYQWREGPTLPGDVRDASQQGAPSVHILWSDLGSPPDFYSEVVYQFGGTIIPHDDDSLCPPGLDPTCPEQDNAYATNRVVRMVNPTDSLFWDESVEDMTFGRVNHNAVILLDGSVLIVGGLDRDSCQARTTAERFKPEEIFGGSSPPWRWQSMDTQQGIRGYHSVAGLLPDGRAYSAGGFWNDPVEHHTVELYSPPYMFTLPRPVILTDFDDVELLGTTRTFDVKVRNGGGIDRVALVRPGSVTHAFDMSQRYIGLPHTAQNTVGDTWEVVVTWPPNGFVAPPGWYMLTVVGGISQTPSEAKWIHLQLP